MVSASRPDLCVAIDFGTTYTGVAWVDPKFKNVPPQIVSDWPEGSSGDASNERKVPSIIAKHPDASGSRKWGFYCDQDTVETDKWRYLKIFLDPHMLDIAKRKGILPAPSSIAEVHQLVIEYLSNIYSHTKKSILMRIGRDASDWDTMAIEFVFSVPTTWQGQEILDDFNTIIRRAGFGVPDRHEAILGLTEAEAAAVASVNHVGSSISFDNGDVFLSIDAGGGTTDLAFVKTLSARPPTMEQVQDVRGTGVGSMMIDMSFKQLVSERLEAHTGSQAQLPDDLPLQLAQSPYYKSQKHKFGDSDYDLNIETYRMPIFGVHYGFSCEELGVQGGYMLVKKAEIARIFDQQMERIFDLLKDALDTFEKDGHKNVKYVILSGGLGSSAYVLKRLKEHIARSDRICLKETTVQMCADPQLVVAKGLLLEQLDRTLRTRIARASYGVVVEERYSKQAHFNPKIVVDAFDGHRYSVNQLKWFVKRGDKMPYGKVLTVPIERRVAVGERLSWNEIVVSSDNPDGYVPLDMADPTAKEVFELQANLTNIPEEQLVIKKKPKLQRWKPKKDYYVCRYDIHLTIGPCGDLRFEIKYNGEILPGSGAPKKKQIQFEWDTTPVPEETAVVGQPSLWESASRR